MRALLRRTMQWAYRLTEAARPEADRVRDAESTQRKTKLTARDLRALTPLIWEHVNPYGRSELDMEARLPIN